MVYIFGLGLRVCYLVREDWFGLVFFFFLEASLISFNIIILGCVTHLKVIIFRYPCPNPPLVEITPDIQDLLLLLRKRVGTLIPPNWSNPRYSGPYVVPERYPGQEYPLVDLTPDIQDLLVFQKYSSEIFGVQIWICHFNYLHFNYYLN